MMAVLRITAIFFTILVLHNNYVSSRPDGQLSTAEAEDVTETQDSAVTEESVTEIESFEDFESRKKRETDEEDSEDEESSEEDSEEEYNDEDEEELEEGVFHRVLDMAFNDVPTSADGLMEDYYLVI